MRIAIAYLGSNDLPFHRLQLVIGVGGREIEENTGNAIEIGAAPLPRRDRVFEGRWLGTVCDGRGLGLRPCRGRHKCFAKIAWLQPIERRRFKRPGPNREQRVFRERIFLVHEPITNFVRRSLYHSKRIGTWPSAPSPTHSATHSKTERAPGFLP